MARDYKGYPGNWATDGNGCYDADGKCYCGDCYYYGEDYVNCVYAGDYWHNKNLKPVKWDGNQWILDIERSN